MNTKAQPSTFKAGDAVAVQVFAPLSQPFDYWAQEDLNLGDVVEVPFGASRKKGIIWGEGTPSEKLKTIEKRLDYPPMRPHMRQFVETMAEYTITPIGQILPMLYRADEPLEPKPNAVKARLNFEGELTPKRRKIYDQLLASKILPFAEIDATRVLLKSMVDDGALEWGWINSETLQSHQPTKMTLTPNQIDAVEAINHATTPVLLKGVTGSGKTEVYLEAVAEQLEKGKQAVILLPEIALTAAFLERFHSRFGFAAGHWHSDMTPAARRTIWHEVAAGKKPVVIGARSAIFLPFQNLGLVVVDEEHDRGYKQEEGVIYHARDMAVLRAHIEGAQIVLASATPSIETMLNAEMNRYLRVDLEERFGKAELPEIQIADMREAGLDANQFVSPMLQQAIEERLERGEQSLLFLNRRGFAPLTLCRACGHQMACPNCDARLVEHRHRGGLICHQCGYRQSIPKACPECEAEDKLVPLGPGVERVADEIARKIPDIRICILSSDITSGEERLRTELRAIENGEYDVIIGTQMVAKGHNFPLLTLVGIIDADIGLEGGDLRASESSFQILRQVSGRAGRYEKKGLAIVQSYQPDHPILQAILNEDDSKFYNEELERRRWANAPPFSRYIALIIWAADLNEASQIGRKLLQNAQDLQKQGAVIWGPVPAPISKIRGRSRVRMLIKIPKSLALHKTVQDWVSSVKTPSRVKIQIDVDPQSFL